MSCVSRILRADITVIDVLSMNELRHQVELYKQVAQAKTVWKLASHSDSFVRKAVYGLICAFLRKKDLDVIDFSTISINIIQEALHIDQTGSAYDYIKMLVQLSDACPGVWTEYYTGSGGRSAYKRLCQCLSKGSQGGPPDFWKQMSRLFELLPLQIIYPADREPITEATHINQSPTFLILDSIHNGINRRDEHQGNCKEAWRTYLKGATLLLESSSSLDSRQHLIRTYVTPLMDQYLKPACRGEKWAVVGLDQDETFKNAMFLILETCPDIFETNWQGLSNTFIQDLQLSLPEQSKDYTKSQDSVVHTAKRWYTLQASIIKSRGPEHVQAIFKETSAIEIKSAAVLLTTRNGKPYCAAASLELALRLVPESTVQVTTTRNLLLDFIRSDIPNLLLSPSSPYLIGMLSTFEGELDIRQLCKDSIKTLMNAPDSPTKFQALQSLLYSPWLGNLGFSSDMILAVRKSLENALHGNESCWPVVAAAMANPSLPDNLTDDLLTSMIDALTIESETATGLHGLELAIQHNKQGIKRFCASPKGATLISRLLFLTESPIPGISHKARKIDEKIREASTGEGNSGISQSSRIDMIKNGIETANAASLS